jgi:sigma-B regulation protein RsbU (phosphoserine phosphatase)
VRLRTALLVSTSLLVAGIIGATVLAVSVIIARAERGQLGDNLERSHRVFADTVAERQREYFSDCHVVANEPRLRAAAATEDISADTIAGVIDELKRSVGSDVFILLKPTGVLVADASDPDAAGIDYLADPVTGPLVRDAQQKGDGDSVWIIVEDKATKQRHPYQVHGCRVDFGETPVGIIIVGSRFGDAAAESVLAQTGSSVVVTLDGTPVASSRVGGRALDATQLAGVTAGSHPADLQIAGGDYLAVGDAFPLYAGKAHLRYAVLRSIDEALAPGRRLTIGVLGIAGIALVAALFLAILLARRLSRPVDELVRFTRKIGRGQLDQRAKPTGTKEVKDLALAMNLMIAELETARQELTHKERLEREMEIAMKIQTSMLPRSFAVSGLDIAARMIPASEVGGDYYDIIPTASGCWLGVGDVAGHGLTAGLEMLMVQSVVAALVQQKPDAPPREHLRVLNHVIYENIRNRLGQDEHITLTLLSYRAGVVTFAGAHEDIIVCRAGTKRCERFATPGTWLGAIRDIGRVTEDSSIELGGGDIMVLYSDGITEALNSDRVQFGIDRLCEVIESLGSESVDTIRDRIIEAVQAWQSEQTDDISLLVVRRKP